MEILTAYHDYEGDSKPLREQICNIVNRFFHLKRGDKIQNNIAIVFFDGDLASFCFGNIDDMEETKHLVDALKREDRFRKRHKKEK